jgi:hypothetical protein
MAHDDPHFDRSTDPVTEKVHLICLCMCPECVDNDLQESIGYGCICPQCDHNFKEDDEDQAPAGAGGSAADPPADLFNAD